MGFNEDFYRELYGKTSSSTTKKKKSGKEALEAKKKKKKEEEDAFNAEFEEEIKNTTGETIEDIAPLAPKVETGVKDYTPLAKRIIDQNAPKVEARKKQKELEDEIKSIESELGYDKTLLEQAFNGGWVTDIFDFVSGAESPRSLAKQRLKEAKAELDALKNGKDAEASSSYFKKGAFEDGLQFEDLYIAPLATAADAAKEAGKGFLNLFEGVSDLILHGVGYGADKVGADKVGDYLHKEANENSMNNLVDSLFTDSTEENSLIGDKGRGIAQGVGQLYGMYATLGLGKAAGLGKAGMSALSTGTTFGSSAGRGISEAYNYGEQNQKAVQEVLDQLDEMHKSGEISDEQYNEAKTEYTAMMEKFKVTDGEAFAYGMMAGASEAVSEMFFGGLGKGIDALGFSKGLSGADDILAKKVTSKFKSQIMKNFAEFGIKAGAEGVEEILAGIGNATAKKLSYMSEEDYRKLIEDENLLESFIQGTIVSGMAQSGVVPGMSQDGLKQSIQSGRDFITGMTQNEQTVVDKVANDLIAEQEKKDGKKLSGKKKAEIYEDVENRLNKGDISTDTIEEVLGGDSYKTYQETKKNEDALQKEYDELLDLDEYTTTNRQRKRLNELEQQIAENKEKSELDFLQRKYKSEVYEIAKGDRLVESYNERARRGQAFAADLSKYDKKQREVIQKAIDSGVLNNTNRAHEFVDLVAKIAADKGVSFDFTNNEKLKSSGFAIDGKFVNGYLDKKTGTVGVNLNSAKALNTVVGHEITHVLEGTELYNELSKAIVEYAKLKGDYQGRIDTLSKLYDPKDIDSELTADLVGEYLFTDEAFINNLSTKHRNVFQKLYDEIKYLYKSATAGSKEARELEKVKRAFEKAYRAQKNTAQDGGTKYALSKDINGNVFVDVTEDIFDTNNGESVARTIQKVISERFNNLIDVHGQKIQINKTTNDEFRRSESVNHLLNSPSQAYDDKLKTIANADEILSAAKNWIGEEIKHVRKDDIVEFARGNVMYRVGENGYVADVIVGTRKNGAAVLYDLVNIYDKKITEAPVTMASNDNSQRRQDASAKPIVSQKENVVNRKFSLSESQNSLSDSDDTYSRIYDMQVEVNKLTESIREFEKTAEFKNAMDNLSKAIDDGDIDSGVKAYQKWRVDSGYDELVNKRDSMRVELEKLRKDFNDGIANKAIAEEKAAIEKSGLSEAEYFRKQAVKEFGYTPHFYDAGYITPNGKMLNFSGEKGKHYGTRGQDHRAIGTIYAETEGTDALNRFVKDGNIRIMAESPGIDISSLAEPTKEQYATIRKFVSEYSNKDYFNVDFTDESGKVIGSLTYENRINPTRVLNDIKHYYETGEIREQSNLDRFRYSLSEDSEGKQLSDKQAEYFKDSKMRDDNGNLKVMYHGTTRGGFHTFNQYASDDGTSFFFVDRNDVASSYSGTSETYEAKNFRTAEDFYDLFYEIEAEDVYEVKKENGKFVLYDRGEAVAESDTARGIYEEWTDYSGLGYGSVNYKVYLNLKNPLEVDAKGGNWNEIEFEPLDNGFTASGRIMWSPKKFDTREIAKYAKEQGYDGVIFKNIVDVGGYGGSYDPATVAIAFDSEQIKSVGNDAPTSDPDIRYSLSDSQGRGLTKEQSEFFKDSKIKDENGNLLVMYHGTPNGEFTVFKDGTYFTANKEYADKYQNPGASSLNSRKVASSPKTFEVYLNITKPFDISDPEAKNIYINDYIKGGNAVGINPYLSDAEYDKIDSIDWTEGEDLREFLVENGYDYDGLVLDEGATGGYGEDVEYRGTSYVVFSPEQVKNVDNQNPTSDPDTRKSLSAESEASQRYGKYNVYGKDIAYEGAAEDVAPIRDDVVAEAVEQPITERAEMLPDDYAPMSEDEAAMIENEALDSLTDEDAPPEVEMPYYDEQRDTVTVDDESLKGISERASEYLGLGKAERKILEGIIQNYSQNENLTRDDLYSELKENFSVLEDSETNEDIVQIKKYLRDMRLYVSDEIKADFGKGAEDGYAKFLRSNFGRLRVAKDRASGVPVDSAYMELSDLYPSYFPEDIINPADQLRRIAEMAGTSSEEYFPMELSDAEIEAVSDMVYTDISDYMNEMRLNSALDASHAPIGDMDAPIEEAVETENKVLSVREMYEQKKQNYRDTLAAHEAGKEKALANFQEAIGKKLDEYNSLKNKNTKRANTLLQQIENLRLRRDNVQADYANRIAKQQARLEAFESKDFEEFEQKELAVRRKDHHKQIVDNAKAQFEVQGYDLDEVLKKAKDLSTFATVDNTPQRVMEKALGWDEGHILADITVNKVAQDTTEGIKWLNSYLDRKHGQLVKISKEYGIKPGSKESAAAQMYAEGFYVDENNEVIKYSDAELAKDFPNGKVRENIKRAAKDQRIRQIYDETLDKINESRRRNGYPEIPRLDNYFLHFRAMDDTFSRLGLPFNPNDIRAKDLPTDLNGVTADLKPGQPYFASAKHRTGQRTSFDLFGGLEKYLTSAMKQIYYIDDIQTLRALRDYVAESYGQAKGLENLDTLTEEEVQEKIEKVYGAHLSTFAKFLNEEANILAGKTTLIDRGLEGFIGRRAMTFMDTVNRQVGSNMVGYNVSSALTNLIAPVQAFAKTNKFDFIKGFAQTVANKVNSIHGKGDGFTETSPVVIRRKGADRFHRTFWQKLSDPGYALMGAVDNFSTELIARAKYNELTRKGMDSETAHLETDKWVSRLMGDRSLGQMPQLYNSKMLGLVTKFQLEVRNQLDSQFYDTIKEANASTEDIQNGLHRNAKKAAKIASTFFTLAVGQHMFGKAFESIAGYNPAFDIISVMIKALGFDDDEESEDTVLDNIEQGFFELMGDMPYTSILEGGRIPISSALPIEELYKGKDQYGNEKSRWETVLEALPYYAMPGGYGQYKKTSQGLGMFDEDLPISGSYTDSGKLRFPVEDNLWKRVQAGLFGQYASENARDYFDNERKALDEKQIQEFVDSGISIQEYWDYREGLSGLKTLNEKADYIYGLDIPDETKNLFINNLSGRKEDIDLSGMEGYKDFNEYDFAVKNPEKYEWLKGNGISVEEYEGADEETKYEYDYAFKYPEKYAFLQKYGVSANDYKNGGEEFQEAYTWAFNNPEKHTLSKAVSDDLMTYRKYTSDLYDIKADKDENGKSISGSRKEKVIDYINGLDADYGEKIILFKTEYPSDDTYNSDIIDYLNDRADISYSEMVTILRELGFKVNGNNVTWD